jgi:Asp-tRNA(Asn)/Glu-tRNA(Gln) amidotransferase A subunit family amidase
MAARKTAKYTRREFIEFGAAATGATMISNLSASAGEDTARSPRLETLTDWLHAAPEARKQGLQQCLQRIHELDPSIHAWVEVKPEAPTADGPLSGIPFGAKDIIETKGMATEYGSPAYKGRLGTEDAAIIRLLRSRGATLLGKTVTTPFAYKTPGLTRNPRALNHTPGGSSSGSAAAVAAGMVPFAVGEQTRGSIIRPASFCGITGLKPTYDLLPMQGLMQLSKSLDTLGFFTHTPADMTALWQALGKSTSDDERSVYGIPEPAVECDPEMADAFNHAIAALRRAGCSIEPVDIKDDLKKLDDANNTVMFYEGARHHEQRYKQFGDRLDPALGQLIRDGLKMPAEQYEEAKKFIADCRTRFSHIFQSTPVILTPAAPGPAPLGLSSTGDARVNAPWTAMGMPALTIPMPVGAGLPLGLQLTADIGQDAQLLRAGLLVDRFLRS